MVRDVYVVKDPFYLCAESLIQIEMGNDSVDNIFFLFLKAEKRVPFRLRIPEKNIFFYYMLYDMRRKKKRNAGIHFAYQWRKENKDVENKTGILYNDTVDQLKGM